MPSHWISCILILFVILQVASYDISDTIEIKGKIITGDDPDDLASVLDYMGGLLSTFYNIDEILLESTIKTVSPMPADDFAIADRLSKLVTSLINLISNETALNKDFQNEISNRIDHSAKLLNTVQNILKYFQDEKLDDLEPVVIPDGDVTDYVIKTVEEIMRSFYEETKDVEFNKIFFPKENLTENLRKLTSTTVRFKDEELMATTINIPAGQVISVVTTTTTFKPVTTTGKPANPGKLPASQQTTQRTTLKTSVPMYKAAVTTGAWPRGSTTKPQINTIFKAIAITTTIKTTPRVTTNKIITTVRGTTKKQDKTKTTEDDDGEDK